MRMHGSLYKVINNNNVKAKLCNRDHVIGTDAVGSERGL